MSQITHTYWKQQKWPCKKCTLYILTPLSSVSTCWSQRDWAELEDTAMQKRSNLVVWAGRYPSEVGCFMTLLPGPAGAVGEHFIHPMDCCFKSWVYEQAMTISAGSNDQETQHSIRQSSQECLTTVCNAIGGLLRTLDQTISTTN